MRSAARHLIPLSFCLCLFLTQAAPARAQTLTPRFGLGFNTLFSTSEGADLGLGIRGRASAPINQDLSIAVDLGFTGFILGGRRDATYVFDPQVSAIITFPSLSDRAPYILAGIGTYLPLSGSEDSEGGPTIHGGIGWVRTLLETTIFYEIDPALIVGADQVHLAFPLRLGIIF